MSGWIKLHRGITSHWIWEDPVKLKWWLDLIMLANHEDKKVNIGMQLIECKRGQSVMSLSSYGKRWKVTKDKARNFFSLLESDGMITRESITKTTRITICNYDDYQDGAHDSQTLTKRKPNASSTLAHPNKNDKNVKNSSNSNELLCEAAKPHAEKIDYDSIVSFFNLETKGVFGNIKSPLSDKRKKMISARIKEHGKRQFAEVISKAAGSSFLKGQNNRGWTATFDWIIKPSNFEKILSGNYDNKSKENTGDNDIELARNVLEGIARANFEKQRRQSRD